MPRFWFGVGAASLFWATAAVFLVVTEKVQLTPTQTIDAEKPARVAEAPTPPKAKRRRRPRQKRTLPAVRTPTGTATVGDVLGEEDMRELDMERGGGEQQLRRDQVEAGFDQGMPAIRRCLVLMAGEDEVHGRLTFALRIEPNGRVDRVRLTGPRAATTGEAGACLQRAARAMHFDAFNGPAMIVRRPIILE